MKRLPAVLLITLLCLMIILPLSAAEEGRKKESFQETKLDLDQIVVTPTGKIINETLVNMPAVVESVTPEGIERINAIDTSDVFKYMPGSYLRKLAPGSTNRPLIIRGNASFLTARTLVLADGIRISDFLAAGNSNGPRWQMVAPEEIERVDVIYGPYSAALSGNSLSGTAMITTRFAQKREVQVSADYYYQHFREYRTDLDLRGTKAHVSYGDKIGDLSFLVWYDRLETGAQPTMYTTRLASTGGNSPGKVVTGWVTDSDPQGNKRIILGGQGKQDLVNNTIKVKLAYDLTSEQQLRFIWTFWDADQQYGSPETYLRDALGRPVYSGTVVIDGKSYNLAANTFTFQKAKKQDFLYALTYDLKAVSGLKISASSSFYDLAKDITRQSSTSPPDSGNGGAGKITDNDNRWNTADLKGSYDIQWFGCHTLGGGYHFDHYSLDSATWNASDWEKDIRTSLSQRDQGKTRTHGFFLEDFWKMNPQWSLYLGGRYEWWKGFDGVKSIDGPGGRITTALAEKNEGGFSPKFSTTFKPTKDWRLRFSLGLANRYPTVGELFYGGITPQGIINNGNPDLKPEKILARDFTLTRTLGSLGDARLTFFEDEVRDAINSQTNFYTKMTNYQNVNEVRTRGIELALNIERFLIPGLALFSNAAWTDSEILRNDAVPASVGKTFPRVPKWRLKCVLDYAPSERWFVTLAGHYGSKQFGTLDNSDTHDGYGAIDRFLVFDTKFSYRWHKNLTAAIGIDNLTDQRYHVSHPYPMRTFYAHLKWAI